MHTIYRGGGRAGPGNTVSKDAYSNTTAKSTVKNTDSHKHFQGLAVHESVNIQRCRGGGAFE